MNGFEEKPEVSAGGEVGELREEVQALRTWLCVAIIVMIAFSVSTDLFFLKQVSVERTGIAATEQNTETEIQKFNTAKAIDFWNRLVQYSRAHPDFVPVINKYSPALKDTLLGQPASNPKP